jgi:hypothetical protein
MIGIVTGIAARLWGFKAVRYALYAGLVLSLAFGFLKWREHEAVARERLERALADEQALRSEAERQRVAAESALAAARTRAAERAAEIERMEGVLNGYRQDLASGIAVPAPYDDAYLDRLRAIEGNSRPN